MNSNTFCSHLTGVALIALLSTCGGRDDAVKSDVLASKPTHTIGGSVSGLASGSQVVLNNLGGDPVSVNADGNFKFATPVAYSGVYSVTVAKQPAGRTCTVSNGTGAGVVADVSTIRVICSATTFAVAGAVFGLVPGQQVTLLNNGADATTRGADGNFAFPTPVALNSGYAVTIQSQPSGQTCTVTKGAGAGVVASISNVGIVCSDNTFTVSGTIDGLAAGSIVALNNNSADPLILLANGAFTFATPVAYKGAYTVSVGTQPLGKTCTVSNATGLDVAANVGNVRVTCSTNTYTVSGVVSGLAAGTQVTLNNNGADPVTVAANGAFRFSTPVAYAGSFEVTVGTNPANERCIVSPESNSAVTMDVGDIRVDCKRRSAYVYAANSSGDTVSQYTIGEDGALVPMIPASIPVSGAPGRIAVDPSGQFAYVLLHFGDSIAQYSIGPNGALSLTSHPLTATGHTPAELVIDPTGRYMYVTRLFSALVSQYRIDIDGSLVPLSTPSITLPEVASAFTIDPTGRYFYASNFNGASVSQFSIGADGALSPMSPATVASVEHSYAVAVDPSGHNFYVSSYDGREGWKFEIGQDGALSLQSTMAAEFSGFLMRFDPLGRSVYMADGNAITLSQYLVGPGGALTQVDIAGSFSNLVDIRSDATGTFEYVLDASDRAIYQFKVDKNGLLSPLSIPKVATGLDPRGMAVAISH